MCACRDICIYVYKYSYINNNYTYITPSHLIIINKIYFKTLKNV